MHFYRKKTVRDSFLIALLAVTDTTKQPRYSQINPGKIPGGTYEGEN